MLRCAAQGRLLARRSVVDPAIRLDDQAEARPEEINPAPAHLHLRLRRRQSSQTHNRQESTLEPGVAEGLAAEQPTQACQPVPAGDRLDRNAEGLGIDQTEAIGLVDCPFHLPVWGARRNVDKGRDRIGHRYPRHMAAMLLTDLGSPMHANAWTSPEDAFGHDDVDPVGLSHDPPENASATTAEHRLRPTAQHRCHPPPLPAHFRSPDGIDTTP
jgi:hypothetical protein